MYKRQEQLNEKQIHTHSNLTNKQMNGANQYPHTSTNIHTHAHTLTLTHTHTQIQFLIREVATEVNWNGSTVKKGRFSGSS